MAETNFTGPVQSDNGFIGNLVGTLNGDTRGFTATTTVRQVTNRTTLFNQISGSNTLSGWRSWQISYVPIKALQIAIANWYVNSGVETGTGGTMTVPLYVEYPHGTWTPIFQNGAAMVIANGATGVTDLTPINIPAFTPFRISGSFTMGAAGRVPSCGWTNTCDRGNGDEYAVGAGTTGHEQDDTVLGTGLASAVQPQAVMALSNRDVWCSLGDSIAAGVNDFAASPDGGRGMFGRSLAKLGPQLNYGCPGDQAVKYVAGNALRLALMQLAGANNIICELGVNDIFTAARTSAQLLADRATIAGLLSSASWYQTTITPNTTSSDNWQTATNQASPNSGDSAVRITFNDALRNSTSLPYQRLIDIASRVETATTNQVGPVVDGGVWIPGLVGFSDGVHPSSNGYEVISGLVDQLLAAA